jgi:DNA-binding GntR family transcriptional regulator
LPRSSTAKSGRASGWERKAWPPGGRSAEAWSGRPCFGWSRTVLREINDEEFLEIYDLRIAIECLVIRKAAGVVNEKELQDLAFLAGEIDHYPDEDEQRVKRDAAFHNRLCEISHLSYAPRMLRLARLHAQCSVLNQRLIFLRGYLKQEIPKPNHRDIVEVLGRKEPHAAEAVMREHLEAAKAFVLKDIERIKSRMADRAANEGVA